MAEAIQLLEGLTILIFLIIISPVIPNKRWRYYTCHTAYCVLLSASAIVLFPIIVLRPRNIANLRFVASIFKLHTSVLGIDWELRNGHILKEDRGAVIAANHQSILDIMGMFSIWDVMDKCFAVAKKELLYIIPFGPVAWLCGLVFINRVDPKKANTTLSKATEIVKTEKAKLWMFPEGTRNKKAIELLPFKRGAFKCAIECNVPIIPIVYSPYYFIDSKKRSFGYGKIIISTLDPISTEGMTLDDINALRDKTYKVMSEEYRRLKDEISTIQNNNVHKRKS